MDAGPGENEFTDGGGDPVCDQTTPIQISEPEPPDLLLVVDKSGSMDENLLTNQQKWAVMRSALGSVVTSYDGFINFGLILFPNGDECTAGTVRAQVAPTNATTITAALNTTIPEGGTPTHTTLTGALGYYQSIPVNPNGRFVLLATDGQPNCRDLNDPGDPTVTESISAIQLLTAQGIKTFVLGFGDAINADPTTLQLMALAGGTMSYYAANSPAQLQMALDDIVGEVSIPSCTFNLEETPADPSRIGVFFDDVAVPQSPSHANGWDYDAATNSITIYGASCDALQAGDVMNVRVDYGCAGPIVN